MHGPRPLRPGLESPAPAATRASASRELDGGPIPAHMEHANDTSAFMTLVVTIALGCILVWLGLSVRLAWIARRTRMAPEIAMAVYFFLLALATIIGTPAAVAQQAGDLGRAHFIGAISHACFWFAATALALGTWRTFRADSRLVGWICAGLFVEMGALFALTLRSEGLISLATMSWPNLVFALSRCGVYGWAFVESLLSYKRLKRQAALGLADVAVARRILFWGLGSFGLGATAVAIIIRNVTGASQAMEVSVGGMVTIGFSLVGTAMVWMAFFPPRFARSRAPGQDQGTADQG